MCDGSDEEPVSPTNSEFRRAGGAVAVIHPRPASTANPHPVSCKIYLQCQNNEDCNACAVFGAGSPDLGGLDKLTNLQVYIHRDGDLQRSGQLDSSGPLLSFNVTGERSERYGVRGSHYVIRTPVPAVNLGHADPTNAASTGIIGRRVSLVDGGEVVGDGIFGVN